MEYTSLQKVVAEHPDQMLPFRELAPSRVRYSGPDGPFAPDLLYTREGFFSALLWRGITFTTEFSKTNKMVFRDLTDWDETMEKEGQTHHNPLYFCDPGAYGVQNPGRKVGLAPKYDSAVDKHDLAAFLKNTSTNFYTVYETFFRPGVTPVRFPHLGPLAAFLLTSDYSYHAAVDKPTLEEVGKAIQHINRGGARGLELAGFMDQREKTPSGKDYIKTTIRKATTGVKEAYDFFQQEISEDDWITLGFDEIVVENTLCKFSKAVKRNLI